MTTFHDLSHVSDLPRHHPYSAAQARAVAESRSALLAAASLPRDERLVRHRLLSLCSDPHFAVFALCCDAPTLTLAETAARLWGNLTFGLRERACEAHICEQEAFACDLETNVQAVRRFRARRAGGEENAFLLAALLDVLPAPLMAEALERCRATLSEPSAAPTDDTTPDPAAGSETPAPCEAAPTSEAPDLCCENKEAPDEAPSQKRTSRKARINDVAGEVKVDAAPAGSAKKRGRPRRATDDATSALPAAPSEDEARPVAAKAEKEHEPAAAKKARRRSAPENEKNAAGKNEEAEISATPAANEEGNGAQTGATPDAAPAEAKISGEDEQQEPEDKPQGTAPDGDREGKHTDDASDSAAGGDERPLPEAEANAAVPTPSPVLRYRPELIGCPELGRDVDTLECHGCLRRGDCPAYA
ncbi:hypothetical protein [uncultured Mailhella sp.]|uniref:hypothetical protein n=1 Tax=uncultured Mailhella sp. TaxID=1981031 RepID=UPI0025F60158|nr:hypothetical protein [uncultured Mailhella sp.]